MKQNLSLIFGIYLGLMSGCLLAMNALSKKQNFRTPAQSSQRYYLSPAETLRYKFLIQKSEKIKRMAADKTGGKS